MKTIARLRCRPCSALTLLTTALALTSCGSIFDGPDTTDVHFSGVIRTMAGDPISGAAVSLNQGTFVFYGSAVSDTTGADGRYDLQADIWCAKGEDIRGTDDHPTVFYLVVHADGYEERSHVNIGRTLLCVSAEQVVDFTLPPAATAGSPPGTD